MPLLVILSIEVHLAEWNGDRFSKNQIRKKKIVPDPKNIENRDGGQDRFDKRQNDQHKALQNAAAVKQRSLFQFSRDGGYKAPDQKNRNRTLQPAINQDQSPYMPSHMQIPRCRQQGNHDRVKGYKHRGKKQQHEACRPAGFPFCKRVSCERTDDQIQDHNASGQDTGVQQRFRKVCGFDDCFIVLECWPGGERDGRGQNFPFCFKRVDDCN